MSTINHAKTKSVSTLFVLLGALTFTLSSLPGGQTASARENSGSSSLSSSSCDLDSQLQSGNHGECLVSRKEGGREVKAKVKVDLVEATGKQRDPNDPTMTKFVQLTTRKWAVQVVDLETECKDGCPDGVIRGDSQHKDVSDLKDLAKVIATANSLWDDAAKTLAKDAAAAHSLAIKKDNCEINADGEKLTTNADILNCKKDRLADMDEEKAAKYFEDKIQPDIEKLAISKDPADQRLAATLMNGELGKSGNKVIAASMQNLKAFAAYSTRAYQLSFNAQDVTQTAQDRQVAQQQLALLQRQWGGYFAAQGRVVQGLKAPTDWTMDVGSALSNDIAGPNGYINNLDGTFAGIATNHAAAVNGTAATTPFANGAAAGSGRTLHGTPTTSLGGPSGSPQVAAYGGAQQGQYAQPNQALPGSALPAGTTGLAARRIGMPVQ